MAVAYQDRTRTNREPISPEPEADAARVRTVALVAITMALVGLCVLLLVPFLPGVTWGVALAIIAWPMHAWLSRHIASRGLASVISTLVVVAVILSAGMFVVYNVAMEAGNAADHVVGESVEGVVKETMTKAPVLKDIEAWMSRANLNVEDEARKVVTSFLGEAKGLASGSLAAVVQFLVAVFVLFYIFKDRGEMMRGVREVLPLTNAESDRVFSRAAGSVHANLYATIVTSLIDAVLFGLVMWWVGLPAPVLWASVIFVLAILPVVGSALVWVPASVYLGLSDQWLGASALIAVGLFTAVFIDNLLYALLAGDRMRMHAVPAMIAFIGGLAVFGLSGVILGPAIAAVTEAFLDIWKRRGKEAVQAEAAVPV
jgi:predicted PurR-regulated permease PerM